MLLYFSGSADKFQCFPQLLYNIDMQTPTFSLELKFLRNYRFIAGIDEVGRGPLAGPVVAAAVILDPAMIGRYRSKNKWWAGVRDSKTVPANKRLELSAFIRENSLDYGIGLCTHQEIDDLNIHNATLLCMKRALEDLEQLPEVILLDGKFIIPHPLLQFLPPPQADGGGKVGGIVQYSIVNGDAKVLSIAAASILAKVYRDDLMEQYDKAFPKFGFARHKGYDTVFHRKKLFQYGPCAIHRLTFETVKIAISERFKKMIPSKAGQPRAGE